MTQYSETGMAGDAAISTKISKEAINELPLAHWQGTVEVIATAAAAVAAVQQCRREQLLGFDTETRPAFRKGHG